MLLPTFHSYVGEWLDEGGALQSRGCFHYDSNCPGWWRRTLLASDNAFVQHQIMYLNLQNNLLVNQWNINESKRQMWKHTSSNSVLKINYFQSEKQKYMWHCQSLLENEWDVRFNGVYIYEQADGSIITGRSQMRSRPAAQCTVSRLSHRPGSKPMSCIHTVESGTQCSQPNRHHSMQLKLL